MSGLDGLGSIRGSVFFAGLAGISSSLCLGPVAGMQRTGYFPNIHTKQEALATAGYF